MNFYDFPLTDKQKIELISLIGDVDPAVCKLHDWIVKDMPDDAVNMNYVLPEFRNKCIVYGNNIRHPEESVAVDIWALLELLKHPLPVDGKEMIEYLNAIAQQLDIRYAGNAL